MSNEAERPSELSYMEVGDEFHRCVGVLQSEAGSDERERARLRLVELKRDPRCPSY